MRLIQYYQNLISYIIVNKYLSIDGLEHVISDLKAYLDSKELVVSIALNDINERLINQSLGVLYDTTDNWNSKIGFVPEAGQLIIYSDYKTIEKDGNQVLIPGIKIGSGNAYIQDLAFLDEALVQQIVNHIDDNLRHINAGEREFWNRKLNVNDASEVVEGTLIFNRN